MSDVEDLFDRWAGFYDAIYHELDRGDVEFYRERALAAGGPVLEVGCGTGRIYLELLRAGVDAHGIDASGGMLDVLREKAAAEGLEPAVEKADVREFDLGRTFALVTVPFRAFLHLLSIEDQLGALRRIHDHLDPGGELILDFFVPDPRVIREYGRDKRTIRVDGAAYRRVDHTELADPVDQIARITRELYDPDGELRWETTFDLKLLYRREFELLLRLSPFEEWAVHGGFDLEALESADQEMVWIARKG